MNFTFDPLDPVLLLLHSVWFIVAAALGAVAYRSKNGWMRASLAGMALSIVGLWVLAILPSWWLYFADGRLKWGGQGCVEFLPADMFKSDSATVSCLKQSLKDTVVVIENAIGLGAFVVAFMIWQRKFPKQLAPGEAKPEATGGYK